MNYHSCRAVLLLVDSVQGNKMKLKLIVLSVALAASGATVALTRDLGVLDANASSFGASFFRLFSYGSALGDFTDHYTFELSGASTASGSTSVSMEWGSLDLDLTSVSVTGTGKTGYATKTDSTPQSFSFSDLGAGTYRLDVAGVLKSVSGPLGYAHYSGSIQSVASAAPEPSALAMMLAGLAAVGLVSHRRRQA